MCEEFTGNIASLSLLLVKKKSLCVAFMWKNDCMVCKKMHQAIPSIIVSNPDINFISIEYSNNLSLFKELGITCVPSILFFRGFDSLKPKEVDRLTGFNIESIKRKITQHV